MDHPNGLPKSPLQYATEILYYNKNISYIFLCDVFVDAIMPCDTREKCKVWTYCQNFPDVTRLVSPQVMTDVWGPPLNEVEIAYKSSLNLCW